MALPGTRNIQIYRGDDYAHEFTFVDTLGAAIDLSGRTITAMLRSHEDATDAVSFTVDDTDANTGVITISLPKEDTLSLPRCGVYDVQSVTGGGETETLIRGDVAVTKDVTYA